MELFASDKQHVLDLYCSKRANLLLQACLALFRDGLQEPQVQ